MTLGGLEVGTRALRADMRVSATGSDEKEEAALITAPISAVFL